MDQQIPQCIGPYRLLEPLGRGGMGEVWRAEPVAGGSAVALKRILAPQQQMLQSIRREIRALARLSHPAIVRILDEGTEQGLPWYAMELLEGVSLSRFWSKRTGSAGTASEPSPPARSTLDDTTRVPSAALPAGVLRPAVDRPGKIPLAAGQLPLALRLIRGLCAPLGYLHGEGLVHRDLKPGNVLVRPDGTPVLIDFGLLTRFGAPVSREILEVASGLAGSVHYMAPEQIRGEQVDARADLYSLGCLLYELVTGRRPFVARDARDVLAQHLEAPPLRPSLLVEGLAPELEELILQLLHKSPRQRLGYASDVAAALARLGGGGGPLAQLSAARPYLYRPGFGGRGNELEQLELSLARLRSSRGGLMLIGGESGIGKTRLAVELGRKAADLGVRVLIGEVLAPEQRGQGMALGHLQRPLSQIADHCREHGRPEAQRVFGARGPLLSLYEPSLASLPGLEGHPEPAALPPRQARDRLFAALGETLSAFAEGGPALLVLDDLQWADELSLGWLEHALQTGLFENRPLLVLATYRSDETGEALERLIAHPQARRLTLARLEDAAVASMIGDMLALGTPPELFSRYLARNSEGNPFFVAEYLRAAVDEGLLWRDAAGRWQVATAGEQVDAEADYDGLRLPQTLRALVERRLQGLPAGAALAIEMAALFGREVRAAWLEEALGRCGPPGSLEPVLGELLRRSVLEEAGPGLLRFVHDKLREVASDAIPAGRLPGLHRAVAETLDALPRAEREQHLAALGHHWEAAGEPRSALACYRPAALQAKSRYAHAEAEALYRAALRLMPSPSSEAAEVRNELGKEVYRVRGRFMEVVDQFELALEEARRVGDRRMEGRTLRHLGIVLRDLSRFDEASALFEQALERQREVGDREYESLTLTNLANLYCDQARLEEAAVLYEQSLRIARELGDLWAEGYALGNLAILHEDQGRLSSSLQMQARTLEIALLCGDESSAAISMGNIGSLEATLGNFHEAERRLRGALALHRKVGSRQFEAHALGNLGTVLGELGQVEEGRRMLEEATATLQALGDQRHLGITRQCLSALVRRSAADLERAGELGSSAVQLFRTIGDELQLAFALGECGHNAIARGEDARPFLDEARRIAGEHSLQPDGALWRALDRLERAQAAAEAGQQDRLFRGELLETLPEGLLRWLRDNGQLGPVGE